MRRIVLVVPDLLSRPDGESFLRQSLPSLAAMAEMGEISKVAAMPETETPEALFLGMHPSDGQLRQGPLTVSALGADPPARSLHFHVSLLSFDDGGLSMPGFAVPALELAAIVNAAERLNTKSLTFVTGEQLDHALVWEQLGEMQTFDPRGFSGEPMRPVLPEGDGEPGLRRFIDDSINLLTTLEVNVRRADEGLAPFNCLWPWGQGVRGPVPNLALRRGGVSVVESASLRMAGLARLAGYRHGRRADFGRGVGTKLQGLAERLRLADTSVSLLEAPAELRAKEQWEELEWFVREFDRELLAPLLEGALREPTELTLIAPGSSTGLAVRLTSERGTNQIPFDERALGERSLATVGLPEFVDLALRVY